MNIRLVPFVLMIAMPAAMWLSYVSKTEVRVNDLRSRVETASRQVATLQSAAVIEPRLHAERSAIATRLAEVRALQPAEADEALVVSISAIARRAGVHLDAVATKGVTALAPTPVPSPASSAAGIPPHTPLAAARPEIPPGLSGSRTARVITVSGRLAAVLRFIDGLGHAPVPIDVTNVALQQGDRLTAGVSVDVLTIDRIALQDAKRAELGPAMMQASPRVLERPTMPPRYIP